MGICVKSAQQSLLGSRPPEYRVRERGIGFRHRIRTANPFATAETGGADIEPGVPVGGHTAIMSPLLSAPLLILHAWTLLSSRIPNTSGLEQELKVCLAALRAANKWQGMSEYGSQRTEILYLAQMGLIDFSAAKGEPRFKARAD